MWSAGSHKKGQWSIEGSIFGIVREDSGGVGEGAQWNTCPAHTVLSPKPQKSNEVSHVVVTGLRMAPSGLSPRGPAGAEASSRKRGGGEEVKTQKQPVTKLCVNGGRETGSGLGYRLS